MGLADKYTPKAKYIAPEPVEEVAVEDAPVAKGNPLIGEDGQFTEEGERMHELTDQVLNSIVQLIYGLQLLVLAKAPEEAVRVAGQKLTDGVKTVLDNTGEHGAPLLLVQALTRLGRANVELARYQRAAGDEVKGF